MRKLFAIKLTILGLMFLILYSVASVTVQAAEKDAISIHVLPEDVLYDIDNMKPGDWAPRTVTVQNNGENNFTYQVDINNDGPEKLFKELLLEVNTDNQTLYKGKLADFSGFQGRKVETSQEEELEFIVRFPEHLGNDFQGLNTTFLLTFTASGEEGSASGGTNNAFVSLDGAIDSNGEGPTLPSTASNIFNFLLIGGMLVVIGGTLVIISKRRQKA